MIDSAGFLRAAPFDHQQMMNRMMMIFDKEYEKIPPTFMKNSFKFKFWIFHNRITEFILFVYGLEMKLFCRYIRGLSAGRVSYSLGRLKYIAIYRIYSAGSNIYCNISDAIDFKSNNNNFYRSDLSIIFYFYFLLANQLEPPNNISQVIINQPLSCEHPWRKKSFVEPKAVLGSVKSSSWKFFNFRVSGENCTIVE